jgi:hypothetical protein
MATTVTRAQASIKLSLRQGGDMKQVVFDVDLQRDISDLASVPGALSEAVAQVLAFLAGPKESPAPAQPLAATEAATDSRATEAAARVRRRLGK